MSFFVDFTRFSEHSPLMSKIIIFRHFSSYFGIYVVQNVVLFDVHEIRKNVMVSGGECYFDNLGNKYFHMACGKKRNYIEDDILSYIEKITIEIIEKLLI